jgi:hypothetical protein
MFASLTVFVRVRLWSTRLPSKWWRLLVFLFARYSSVLNVTSGRAIAEAVSCRLSIPVSRVPSQVSSFLFVVDGVALVQVFSEYFGLSCHFSFHQMLYNQLSSRTDNSRPNSGRRTKWTYSYSTPRNQKRKKTSTPRSHWLCLLWFRSKCQHLFALLNVRYYG